MKTGAGNGVRTRDPELGKLVLYQLSYTRFVGRKLSHRQQLEQRKQHQPTRFFRQLTFLKNYLDQTIKVAQLHVASGR